MERVQLNLERQLPELRDLEKKKIFTKKEISEIVKRRTAFENALIRRGSNELDWINYIEYEKKLEQLRRIRYNKLNLKGKPTVSDYSISRHILSLYSSSVTRVPGSTRLWQAYISHVIKASNSTAEISRVLARAIGLHPTNASIWILAIRFEADGTGPDTSSETGGIGGGNIDAARKLVMRALRFMKGASKEDAQRVWLEWVRLEISFIERMRKRWEILGIQEAVMAGKANVEVGASAALSSNDEDSADLAEALPEKDADLTAEAKEDTPLVSTAQDVQSAQKKGQSDVLNGAIVRAVLENACSADPSNVFMYQALVDFIRPLPTPIRLSLLENIYTHLEAALPTIQDSNARAQAVNLLARRHLDDLATPAKDGLSLNHVPIDSVAWIEGVGKAVQAYKHIVTISTEPALAIEGEYAKFLREIYEKTDDASLKKFCQASLKAQQKRLRKAGVVSEAVANAAEACEVP